MKVSEYAEKLNMKVLTGDSGLDKDISGMYVGDLLSWVMSHAGKGNAWITVLTHLNTIAVAVLTEVTCIIIPENIQVEQTTINKAREEGIIILSSDFNAYEICCKSYDLEI